MVGRQRDHDRLAHHRLGGQPGVVDRQRDEPDVQPPLADRLRLIQAAHVAQHDPHLRVLLRELAEDLHEDRRVGRPGHADGELTHLALVHARGEVGGVRGLRQDDARLLHEHPARFGELHLRLVRWNSLIRSSSSSCRI